MYLAYLIKFGFFQHAIKYLIVDELPKVVAQAYRNEQENSSSFCPGNGWGSEGVGTSQKREGMSVNDPVNINDSNDYNHVS